MAANKTTSAQKAPLAPLSFEDAYGATVTIPHGHAQDYAGVRSEQLRVLTQTLAVARSIGLSPVAVEVFTLMANEYALAMESLIGIVADDTANSAKGGV